MPRMYYNQSDVDTQRNLLLVHGAVYLLVITWLWGMENPADAVLITPIWTMLFAAHNFAQMPLHEGLQQRTYNRLRNKFGADWDLAATTDEFELEAKKAQLELALKMVLSGSMTTGSLILAQWVLLVVTTGNAFPTDYFMLAFAGWGAYILAVQLFLRWRLSENRSDLRTLKKKQAQDLAQQRLSDAEVNPQPRIGMTFAVGDDGELIEVPDKAKQSH